ncbi:hypothetical protein NL518_28500, partial [Klebsiella pneumoniae]|nr:hypothetical protein [Klebsiella pneumoniae]
IILLVAGVLATALADEVDQKWRELEDVQLQMEMQQNKATQAQQQVDSVSEQLRTIQGNLDAAASEYNSILSKLAATEQQITVNTAL